ncbi:MAG: envelope stress response membrane protein PspC [Gammaproteobacteria bacterium]|nr:MAG: envelope stress response membrane protein PspC [Gammaproteobacteria bacterium]
MSTRRGELYRNPNRGKIAGVCAGIADYFGWETWLVRILVVSGVLFGMPFLIFGYVAAWFILDKKPQGQTKRASASNNYHASDKYHASDNEQVHRSIKIKARIWQSGEPPKQAFHDIRRKFGLLEKQLQKIEQYVTSSEFTVAREINKL